MHTSCVKAYANGRLPRLTTEAVLAEVFYRDERNIHDARSVWLLLRSGAIPIRRSHMWTYRGFRPGWLSVSTALWISPMPRRFA
jgi:hypothetical protein